MFIALIRLNHRRHNRTELGRTELLRKNERGRFTTVLLVLFKLRPICKLNLCRLSVAYQLVKQGFVQVQASSQHSGRVAWQLYCHRHHHHYR